MTENHSESISTGSLTNLKDSIALTATESSKFSILLIYSFILIITSFYFNSLSEIIAGMKSIVLSQSTLLSDYMMLGNIGAAFMNAGLLMLLSLIIVKQAKVHVNGTIIAAVFTVAGFAFFGKNIFNIWPILGGVYLYSIYRNEPFARFILVALFGTALAPMVSLVSFGLGFAPGTGLVLGIVFGTSAGFILPPLANHMVKFHQGYNIYNIGFTAGMVGSLFMAIFRSFELDTVSQFFYSEGLNSSLSNYLLFLFFSMIFIGMLFNKLSFTGFTKLFRHSGRLVSDFVSTDGFGVSFINMGVMGLISVSYILLVGGEINGPIIGGIFTIVGFAAFGKHPANVVPILIGVFFATQIQSIHAAAPGALLAALFGTTLAPIAGQFGIKAGLLAGFMHLAVVMNVGYLHGGINLYNNGFAGGMVAAMLVPILTSLKRVNGGKQNAGN
ncbi:MAG: DUF1576 domain-containing protein [Bacillota bacterium]